MTTKKDILLHTIVKFAEIFQTLYTNFTKEWKLLITTLEIRSLSTFCKYGYTVYYLEILLVPVVQKRINANRQLKVKQGFHFAY